MSLFLARRPGGRRSRDEGGAIAIVMALCALVCFGLAATVVDLGQARDVRRQSQAAADASALAGGNRLYLTSQTADLTAAADEVRAYAAANYGTTAAEWATCTDPGRPVGFVASATTPCISFKSEGVPPQPIEVRVMMPTRLVTMPFAGVLGIHRAAVNTAAHARLDTTAASPCGLCVIGPGTHVLQNGDTLVTDASVHFNGNVSLGPLGHVTVNGGQITVQGTVSGISGFSPPPQTGQPPINDPLAHLALPPDMTGLTFTAGASPCVKGPGLYGSQNLRNMTCTLSPGLYVISGSSSLWDLAGNSSTLLTGTGVTLYFTCGTPAVPTPCLPGQGGATLDASGNGRLSLTGPSTGPLKGLSIVYDRENTETFRLTGEGTAGFTGSVYMKSGNLLINGNGCGNALNSLIIVKDLEFNGNNACLKASYTPGLNADVPPSGLRLSK